MDKIVIYTKAQLLAISAGATAGRSTHEWLADMRAKVAGMVRDNPRVYRTFGPWWWPLRAQLIAAGLLQGEPNLARVEAVTSGDDVLDMAGAVAYHGYNVEAMFDGNIFTVETESGDTMDYLLEDPDMDALIAVPA